MEEGETFNFKVFTLSYTSNLLLPIICCRAQNVWVEIDIVSNVLQHYRICVQRPN